MTMPLPFDEATLPALDPGVLYTALNDAALVIKPGIVATTHRLTGRAKEHRHDGFQIVHHVLCTQHRQREASIKLDCSADLVTGTEYFWPTQLVIRTIMDQMRAAAASTADPRAHDRRLRQLEARMAAMHKRYITYLMGE
jgi:hypothetical protein